MRLIQIEQEKEIKLTAHVHVPLPPIPSEQTPLLLHGFAADPGHSIEKNIGLDFMTFK